MFSVTTYINTARDFGKHIFSATINKTALVLQPLDNSNKSEYFVPIMWKFSIMR